MKLQIISLLIFVHYICAQNNAELNNNKFFRGISNQVDKVFPPGNLIRESAHGVYHRAQYEITKNERELHRSRDKFNTNDRTDHLANFDKNNPNYKTPANSDERH